MAPIRVLPLPQGGRGCGTFSMQSLSVQCAGTERRERENIVATPNRRTHVLNRLKSIDGHLRGVIRMVEDDAYCIDVIQQLQAVQGAVGRVASVLLEDHLQTCVTHAIQGNDSDERTRVIGELLRLFDAGARTTSDEVSPVASGVVPSGDGGDPGQHVSQDADLQVTLRVPR